MSLTDEEKSALIKGAAIGLVLGAVVHQFTGNAWWMAGGLGAGALLGWSKVEAAGASRALHGPQMLATQGVW